MASADQHKVCFPVVGRPAIVRAIDTYKAAGLRQFLIVVGEMAEQVIATVTASHPEATFVYQAEQRGTGHAALVAVEALAARGFEGPTVVAMGDKIPTATMVHDLLVRFAEKRPDVLITTTLKEPDSTAGRVVTDADGRVLGIVELADIKEATQKRRKLAVAGRHVTPSRIEKTCEHVNCSMYVFRFDALSQALGRLQADNAQGELYLTDTVEHIAATGAADTWSLRRPTDLIAFNTPAELLAVEEVVRRREKPPRVKAAARKHLSRRMLKPAREWLAVAQSDRPKWQSVLRHTYGRDEAFMADRRKAVKQLITAFIKRHGADRPMVLARAPGRVNLMGRHVDHRGGFVNVMAISRETLVAAAPRDDDLVALRNIKPKLFPPREFRIFDLLRDASWADWIGFVDSRTVRDVLQAAQGDWSHYARAPLVRLQHECRNVPLKGMDCVISGNIPMAAGLSSSSALVVAFAEAAVAINGLNVEMHDFINLCGEGEWFVGTRGGSADHAAIRTGRFGHISRIGFFPFRMLGEVRFPPGMCVVLANSGSGAAKSAGARDTFNHRVACYNLAELCLRRYWPAAAGIEHLRDVTPQRVGVKPGEIYRALIRLPVRSTRRQMRKLLPDDADRLEEIFSSHADLGQYDLRGAALFGISEVLRSERFAEVIAQRDWAGIGRFMRDSHDGDRIVRFDAEGKRRKHEVRLTDAALKRLAGEHADLAAQSGRYACSTEAIDQLVDIANATNGVVGAQLAGAGLGGCMMILVRSDALDMLKRRLRVLFYGPRQIPFDVHVCTPVAGAGLLSV